MSQRSAPIDPGDELLPPPVLAAELHVGEPTLQVWRSKRVGPPWVRINGRVIRYRRSDIAEWVRTHTEPRPDEQREGGSAA